MGEATFAVYQNRDEIKIAIRALQKSGFEYAEMQIFQPKKGGAKDFHQVQKYQIKTGIVIGAVLGVLAGIVLCTLVGLKVIPLIHAPKFSMMSALFTIAAVLVFGAFMGAGAGALVGMGTPDPAAKRFGQYLSAGGILLSVHSKNSKQIHVAQQVLIATGGQDVHMMNERETWKVAHLERLNLENYDFIENASNSSIV
jgi:Protein of unknown function (DUF3341)